MRSIDGPDGGGGVGAFAAMRLHRDGRAEDVKSGRSGAGGRAASSHTAALTSTDTTVVALFRQTGVIRARTLREMFGIARLLVSQPLPRGRRLAVLTNSGGSGILCVDAAESSGLTVEPLSEETRRRLQEILPDEASTRNAVDTIATAGPGAHRWATRAVLESAGLRVADGGVALSAEEAVGIAELDLNPVFALPTGEGYRIADARIRVHRSG